MKDPSAPHHSRARGGALHWGRWAVLGAVAAALAILVGQLVGRDPSAVRARHTMPPSVAAEPAARSMPYSLLTHCGIDEARVDQTYFEADQPLVGPGNPPPGWSSPYQFGTMTLLSTSRAVFRDDAGHEVYFHARPGATTFEQLCD